METDDLFLDSGRDAFGLPSRVANVELLEALRLGTQAEGTDTELALALTEQVQRDLLAYGTGGGGEFSEAEMKLSIRALKAVLARLDVPVVIPFRDYTTFRDYWMKNGAHGSWQARRDIVNPMFDPVVDKLEELRDGIPVEIHPIALYALTDPTAIQDHLRRLGRSVDSDPRLAVSVAKDLIESTAKLVLAECGQPAEKEDLPVLAQRAQNALGLTKGTLAEGPGASTDGLKKLLGSLSGVVQGIAELRNDVGVGHGRETVPEWVRPRHARLAAGVATTWCTLLLETLGDAEAPWRQRGLGLDG